MTRELPQEVMVWHSYPLDHIGTWATTRYPDDAVAYVPRDGAKRADADADVLALVEALERALNFIANTESEMGETLECGDMARAERAEAALATARRDAAHIAATMFVDAGITAKREHAAGRMIAAAILAQESAQREAGE